MSVRFAVQIISAASPDRDDRAELLLLLLERAVLALALAVLHLVHLGLLFLLLCELRFSMLRVLVHRPSKSHASSIS